MVESGVPAVLVENPIGPVGLLTVGEVVEAIAGGADPDIVWAGETSRLVPKVVSCAQHPVTLGREMVDAALDVVAVMDEGVEVGVTSALDVLGAVLAWLGDAHDPDCVSSPVATLKARALSPNHRSGTPPGAHRSHAAHRGRCRPPRGTPRHRPGCC